MMERDKLTSLVTAAQKGDGAAMEELFSAFYNDVYYFALKTVKDSDLACDITQETFLQIVSTIGDLKEPAAFVTWMKQIAYSRCTRWFSKKKEVLLEEDEEGHTLFDTLADESEGSIPSEVYEQAEFRRTIMGIIGELTEEQRSAVLLYYFDELSVGQIAQIQGVSDGTVKSRLNYARKAIRRSVEDYEEKNGIRLHSFSLLPLLLLFFGKELMPTAKAAEIQAAVGTAAAAMGATGTAAGAAASGSASASAASGTAATSGSAAASGSAAVAGGKLAALPLVTKIVAALLAVSLVAGCGVFLCDQVLHFDRNKDCVCDIFGCEFHTTENDRCIYCGKYLGVSEDAPVGEHDHTDSDGDGLCDTCMEAMCAMGLGEHGFQDCVCLFCGLEEHRFDGCICAFCGFGAHEEGDVHPFCGSCGERLPLTDGDGDGFCDVCGEASCGGQHHRGSHDDADGDGSCDTCHVSMCRFSGDYPHVTDYSDGIYDGKCDNCGSSIYAIGWGGDEATHEDTDGDNKCECCGEPVCRLYGQSAFGGVDGDGDEVCDICGLFLCDGHGVQHYHRDLDFDGRCDSCTHFICAHGFLPHRDDDGNGICDDCFCRV